MTTNIPMLVIEKKIIISSHNDERLTARTNILPDIQTWRPNFKRTNSLNSPRAIQTGTNIKIEQLTTEQMNDSITSRINRINPILKDNIIQNIVTNDSVATLLSTPCEDNDSWNKSKMILKNNRVSQKQTRNTLDNSRHAYKKLKRHLVKHNLNDQDSTASLANAKNKLEESIKLYQSSTTQLDTSLDTLRECSKRTLLNRFKRADSDPIRLFPRFPDVLDPLIKTQQFTTDNQHRYKYSTF
jgi:hypothetical protein